MTNKELIEALSNLPPDAPVRIVYDGAARQTLGSAWLARGGHICLSGYPARLYYERDWPEGAVPDAGTRHWFPSCQK